MLKAPMEKPDEQGEIGRFFPIGRERFGIETPIEARKQNGTGKLYFGCPNFDEPYKCRFNGCRNK
jgi:hypothetical protein